MNHFIKETSYIFGKRIKILHRTRTEQCTTCCFYDICCTRRFYKPLLQVYTKLGSCLTQDLIYFKEI